MFRFHEGTSGALAAAAVMVLVAGCTASIPSEGLSATFPSSDTADVMTIGVPEDQPLPDTFVKAVYDQTDLRVEWIPLTEEQILEVAREGTVADADSEFFGIEALLGVDGEAAKLASESDIESIRYGEDDVCTLIDEAWFSANKTPIPADTATATGEGVTKGSFLLQVRSMNNTGSASRWQVVTGSCSPIGRYLIPLPTGEQRDSDRALADELGEYLMTPEGQAAIAASGLAFPSGSASGTTIEVELPLAPGPITVQRP